MSAFFIERFCFVVPPPPPPPPETEDLICFADNFKFNVADSILWAFLSNTEGAGGRRKGRAPYRLTLPDFLKVFPCDIRWIAHYSSRDMVTRPLQSNAPVFFLRTRIHVSGMSM